MDEKDTDFVVYKVVHSFKDLKDNNHIYNINDVYPRKNAAAEGYIPDKKRISELMSEKNKIGKVLIRPIESGEK